MSLRIMVYRDPDDDTATDITEGVQTLYDLVQQSMDWGSGFISVEDAIPVATLARACGFDGIDECERYINEKQIDERRNQLRRAGYDFRRSVELAKDPNLTEEALRNPPPVFDPPRVSMPLIASVGQPGAVTTNPHIERITIEEGALEKSIEKLEEAESMGEGG